MARGAKQLRSRALLGALFAILSFPTAHAAKRDPSNVITIVALGDSLTAGYGLSRQQAYPALIAEKMRATSIPFFLEGVAGDPSLTQWDRVHPNAAGQRVLAENVWRVLEPILRKRFAAPNSPRPR